MVEFFKYLRFALGSQLHLDHIAHIIRSFLYLPANSEAVMWFHVSIKQLIELLIILFHSLPLVIG